MIVEEEGIIHANVQAEEAIIQGHFKGCLDASIRVELSERAHFEGELSTPNLMVAEGAQFNGRSTMRSADKKVEGATGLPHGVEELHKKKGYNKDLSALPDISISN